MYRILYFLLFLNISNAFAQTETKITPEDGAEEDFFGSTVSISGDYAIVGAPNDDDDGALSGSAYIFERQGSTWAEVIKLTATDATQGDHFGRAVSIDGNYAIVGAEGDDDNGSFSGSVYIFERQGSVWTEVTKIIPDDGAMDDFFGHEVSISGDYAIVGAWADDDNGSFSGSAYIYERQGSIWAEVAKLAANDASEFGSFGEDVSISGDVAIVGADGDDDNGPASGAVYIFERQDGTWTEVVKLTASDGESNDQFGNDVSISGDYAIVGAFKDEDNGFNSGSAYIFERQGSTWAEVVKLTASDAEATDLFGKEVSISGNYAIVGADGDKDNGTNSGSAYIFELRDSNWIEVVKLTASDGATDDMFGEGVSISGVHALVGAHWDDDKGSRSGSAYVYGPTIPTINSVAVTSGVAGTPYTYQLSASGFPRPVFSLSAAPAGMQIADSSEGIITWTPTVAGQFNVTTVASNSGGIDEQSFIVTISDGPSAPIITSSAITSATMNQAYEYNVMASGNPEPTFNLVANPDPTGMSIDSTSGQIIWTPTNAGNFEVTVRATNSEGTDDQSFAISVNELVPPNIISTPVTTNARVGELFQYDVEATGNPEPSFSLDAFPPGMSINVVTGVIAWIPMSPGRFDVTAVASNGANSQDTQSFTIIVVDASFIVSRDENFGDFTLPTSYQLLSVPGDVDLNISATLEGTPGTDWNAFLDNGADVNYFESYRSGNNDFRFRPGHGFWILSKTNWTVESTTVSPAPLDANGQFTVDTHEGWNIIASPFLDPVSWDAVKAANNLEPTVPLYSYNGQGFQAVTQLEAYKAYYYDSDGSTLSIPHPSYQTPGKTEPQPTLPNLTLQLSDNYGMQSTAQIVLHKDALPGRDAMDQRAPRDDFAPLSLGFAMDSKTLYAIDARPAIQEGSSFGITIKSEAKSEVTLDVIDAELLDGFSLALIDDVQGKFMDVQPGIPVVLHPQRPDAPYRLLVGTKTYLENQREALTPTETILQQNYPNPFDVETTLVYSLSQAGGVHIQVYDVLGRSVATLVEGNQDAGQHQILWNGYDQRGKRVPAGLYFIQLQTESGETRVVKAVKLD